MSEYVEFLAATRAGGPRIVVQIDKDDAEKWGTEGWFLVSGGAAGVGKKIDGVVHLLHRLIMNASEDQEVKFREKHNKFNVRKSNLYLVPMRKKLINRNKHDNGASGNVGTMDDSESDESSDMDSNTSEGRLKRATTAQARPRKKAVRSKTPKVQRQPKAVSVAPVVIEQSETPMHIAPQMSGVQMIEFIPVANQSVPAMNIITTIDHLPKTGRNEIEVVTSGQYFNPDEMRTEWYTISVTDEDADVLRTYLKLRVNGEIQGTAHALKDANATIAQQQREIVDRDKHIAKLQDENARLHLRVKEAARKEKKLENVAAMFLSEQAA